MSQRAGFTSTTLTSISCSALSFSGQGVRFRSAKYVNLCQPIHTRCMSSVLELPSQSLRLQRTDSTERRPNNSFKPNLLRYTKAMAGKACHGFGSTTQVGLTQALDIHMDL